VLHPKTFCQLELQSTDVPATLKFLVHVLGWKAVPIALHEQVVIDVPSDCPFGISVKALADHKRARPTVIPYFRWETSIEDLRCLALQFGGELGDEPQMIPGYGKTYSLSIPGGLVLGIFKPQNPSSPA
jgi:predicted enzyme related to lactoylglutathione lyase